MREGGAGTSAESTVAAGFIDIDVEVLAAEDPLRMKGPLSALSRCNFGKRNTKSLALRVVFCRASVTVRVHLSTNRPRVSALALRVQTSNERKSSPRVYALRFQVVAESGTFADASAEFLDPLVSPLILPRPSAIIPRPTPTHHHLPIETKAAFEVADAP
jgi:hypothetical protein